MMVISYSSGSTWLSFHIEPELCDNMLSTNQQIVLHGTPRAVWLSPMSSWCRCEGCIVPPIDKPADSTTWNCSLVVADVIMVQV